MPPQHARTSSKLGDVAAPHRQDAAGRPIGARRAQPGDEQHHATDICNLMPPGFLDQPKSLISGRHGQPVTNDRSCRVSFGKGFLSDSGRSSLARRMPGESPFETLVKVAALVKIGGFRSFSAIANFKVDVTEAAIRDGFGRDQCRCHRSTPEGSRCRCIGKDDRVVGTQGSKGTALRSGTRGRRPMSGRGVHVGSGRRFRGTMRSGGVRRGQMTLPRTSSMTLPRRLPSSSNLCITSSIRSTCRQRRRMGMSP